MGSLVLAPFRCRIPECDIAARVEYNPHWLEYAVPFKQSRPVKCYRYQSITPHAEQHNSLILTDDQQSCDVNSFNRSAIRGCSEDGFVYRTDEISIVNEVIWKNYIIIITNDKLFKKKDFCLFLLRNDL